MSIFDIDMLRMDIAHAWRKYDEAARFAWMAPTLSYLEKQVRQMGDRLQRMEDAYGSV